MPFGAILSHLTSTFPEIVAVAFCDEEGEVVHQVHGRALDLDPYEALVAVATAASWVRWVASTSSSPSESVRLSLRGANLTAVIEGLVDGYYLIALARPGPLTAQLARVLHEAAVATAAEM